MPRSEGLPLCLQPEAAHTQDMKARFMTSLLTLAGACGNSGPASNTGDAAIDATGSHADAASMIDAAGPIGTPFALVASTSPGRIQVYSVDTATGAFTELSSVAAEGPTFLAFDPQHHTIYAAEESSGTVSAFAADQEGNLSFLNRVSSKGSGPVHVTVDATGASVLVANYGGGTAAVLPINASGQLLEASDEVSPGANAHQIVLDPSNRFAFVPSLGSDRLVQYLFDAATGALAANAVPSLTVANGSGPRHLSFAPGSDYAYLINELDSTMTALHFDPVTGQMTSLQSLSTLPEEFSGKNSTAEVAVHPNGQFLYGSNRGHDSIVSFALASDGRMSLLAHTPTGGAHPRHFSIDPSGHFLYVANRDSDAIHGFRIDPATGALTPLGKLADIARPQFVAVFYL